MLEWVVLELYIFRVGTVLEDCVSSNADVLLGVLRLQHHINNSGDDGGCATRSPYLSCERGDFVANGPYWNQQRDFVSRWLSNW